MDRLEKSGVLLPEQVVIEFNENTQIVSREVLRFAGQAKKMGFRLALDDQGLDGQDPEIVDALPWDIIKLDWRPMMRSPLSEKAHLEAARRAHWNNMELVVEGIESRQDVERAAALFKPSMLQGYYYLPPSNLRAATNFNARNDFTLPLVYD